MPLLHPATPPACRSAGPGTAVPARSTRSPPCSANCHASACDAPPDARRFASPAPARTPRTATPACACSGCPGPAPPSRHRGAGLRPPTAPPRRSPSPSAARSPRRAATRPTARRSRTGWPSRCGRTRSRSAPAVPAPPAPARPPRRSTACSSRRGRPAVASGRRAGGRRPEHLPWPLRTRRSPPAAGTTAPSARASARFLERPAHRLIGDRVDDLQLDELVGQKLHRPGGTALRRRRAGQGDEPGLGPAVELPRSARAVLRLAAQGRLQALLDEPLADPLDGSDADVEGLGDPVVVPSGSFGGGIGLEQDAGVGELLGGRFASGDEVVQVPAFLGGQGDGVFLHGALLSSTSALLLRYAAGAKAESKVFRNARGSLEKASLNPWFAKTQSTHSQRLTAVIVSENVVSTLPGQSTPAADLVGLGSSSNSKATTENNPNKHGTSRKTVASVRPRVVSNPR